MTVKKTSLSQMDIDLMIEITTITIQPLNYMESETDLPKKKEEVFLMALLLLH